MTFIVTVNSTDPIWFYCSLDAHCIAGMVGVVNPPAGQTVSDYVEHAAGFRASAPSALQGGILTSLNSGTGGSTSMSSVSSITSMSSAWSITSMSGSTVKTPPLSSETTFPSTGTLIGTGTGTGTRSATTTEATSTNSGIAATSTPSGGGKSNDASVMLGLGILGGVFVALMS